MRRPSFALLLGLGLLVAGNALPGQTRGLYHLPDRSAAVREAIDRSRALIMARQTQHRFPGVGAAVSVRGRIIWSEGFGWADIEQQVPVSSRTRFRLGSVSKVFCAVAVAALVEQKRLDLDLSVQRSRSIALLHRVEGFRHAQFRIPRQQLQMGWRRFLSTPEDLVRFLSALLHPGFLSAKTLEVMFTPQRLKNGDSTGVGIGWRIDKDSQGRRRFHHGGTIEGGGAIVLALPDEDVAVAIVTNQLPRFSETDASQIASWFAPGQAGTQPDKPR